MELTQKSAVINKILEDQNTIWYNLLDTSNPLNILNPEGFLKLIQAYVNSAKQIASVKADKYVEYYAKLLGGKPDEAVQRLIREAVEQEEVRKALDTAIKFYEQWQKTLPFLFEKWWSIVSNVFENIELASQLSKIVLPEYFGINKLEELKNKMQILKEIEEKEDKNENLAPNNQERKIIQNNSDVSNLQRYTNE